LLLKKACRNKGAEPAKEKEKCGMPEKVISLAILLKEKNPAYYGKINRAFWVCLINSGTK
jgi:hypothetical protein